MSKKLIVLVILLPMAQALSAQSKVLTEKTLYQLAKKDFPKQRESILQKVKHDLNRSSFEESFSPKLEAQGQYYKTKEKQLSRFVPVTSPVKALEANILQRTKFGLALKAGLASQQTTNTFLSKATTSSLNAQLSFDLYKDLFGKSTRAQGEVFNISQKMATIQNYIQTQTFWNKTRSLYWSLVAKKQAEEITQNLLKTARQQVHQAQRRYKNQVADRGEVARYRSQVSSRKSRLLFLQYQQENLKKSVQEMIPSLIHQSFQISTQEVDGLRDQLLACTAKVSKLKKVPWEYTKYDELMALTQKRLVKEDLINKFHADLDLKLLSEVKVIGKDFGFADSFDDLKSSGQPSYSLGLKLTIPFGPRIKTTEEIKRKLSKLRGRIEADNYRIKVESFQKQIIKTIALLKKAVQYQAENTAHLSVGLKDGQKKYRQARINVEQLVNLQDAYLQSFLDEIEFKLAVLTTLLDYLSVFTEFPCQLNRMKL